ncbi:HesA/MoeB/ThiF family protein [Portibacter marinus]|uniref:HesA/MoeB/ThiF family protein n=1 Tax=Portibacter marinus TaxID=2898660 RepID=UPI001F30C789|nr:ThiF family adenylyltransferase [Portibacter marinus]
MGEEPKKSQKLKIENTGGAKEHWDDTFRLMSWWDAERVKKAQVMVVGAGALGNEVLKNLALMNVGSIFIVDFDTIEFANLCRSVLFRTEDIKKNKFKCEIAGERIKEINPNVKVQTVNGDIMIDVGLGVMRRMDVIIGCLDNRIARLFINRYAFKVGKVWIDGAIENLSGQLNVYKNGKSCYECALTNTDWENIRFKMGCADIAQRNSTQGRVPTTPISSSIIAAMQVQEAIKVIHGNEKQSMAGEQFKYDGMNNWIIQFQSEPVRDECDSHYEIKEDELVKAKGLSCAMTIEDCLSWLENHFEDDYISIQLNYKIILEIASMNTEVSHDIIIPEPHFSEQKQTKYQKEPGEPIGITKYADQINRDFPDLSLTLREVGVPPLHILTVETSKDIYFVELTGDESFLEFK